jgi:hypothetical protein
MFWLLRVSLGILFLGSLYFGYDFIVHQGQPERQVMKEDFRSLLDNGELKPLIGNIKHQMSEDFSNRFWPKVKRAFNVLKDDEVR